MELFKYFKLKRQDTTKTYSECLPDASSPLQLAITMPSGSITIANSRCYESARKAAETS